MHLNKTNAMQNDLHEIIKSINGKQDSRSLHKLSRSFKLEEDNCFFVFDVESGSCSYVHSSIKNILGYTKEDFVGKGFIFYKEIIHPRDFSYLINEIVTVIQLTNNEVSKNEICLPINIVHKNGHWVGLKIHVSYLKDLKDKKLDILFGFFEQDQKVESESSSNAFNVSSREKEVLKKLAAGNSAKTIASELSISESTVITHRKNLIQKLKVKNSAELIKRSFELNILN